MFDNITANKLICRNFTFEHCNTIALNGRGRMKTFRFHICVST